MDEHQFNRLLAAINELGFGDGSDNVGGLEGVTMALVGGDPRFKPAIAEHLGELNNTAKRIADALERIAKRA